MLKLPDLKTVDMGDLKPGHFALVHDDGGGRPSLVMAAVHQAGSRTPDRWYILLHAAEYPEPESIPHNFRPRFSKALAVDVTSQTAITYSMTEVLAGNSTERLAASALPGALVIAGGTTYLAFRYLRGGSAFITCFVDLATGKIMDLDAIESLRGAVIFKWRMSVTEMQNGVAKEVTLCEFPLSVKK